MEIFLIKAAQLIVALVILVTIHEFGHYLFARIFGIKVNRFYLFFNPFFSILKFKPTEGTLQFIAWNTKDGKDKALKTFRVAKPHPEAPDAKPTWRSTMYGLGWLPLGGYCDIAGMVDETKSAKDLAAEPQSWEFRSKSAYKRLMVMVAGVLFNFILAIIIYAGIAFHWGDKYIAFEDMTEGMDFSPEMQAAGFHDGDRLIAIDDKPIESRDPSVAWDLIQEGTRVKILRDNDTMTLTIPGSLLEKVAEAGNNGETPMSIRVPVKVLKLAPGEGAEKGGILPGDRIVKIGTDTTPSVVKEFKPALEKAKGKTVDVTVLRDGQELTMPVEISGDGTIGIQMVAPQDIFNTRTQSYSLLQSIPRGWEIGVSTMGTYISSLKMLFTPTGAKSLGGFGTLGSLFPEKWNWYTFWQLTAFLSVILAFMNILPIPGLDGGHTLFLLVEMVTRRKPSEKFLEYANMVGMAFLLLLLLYANANDVFRFLIK